MTISMDGYGPAELLVTPTLSPAGVSLRLAGEMDVATARHLTEAMRALPGSLLSDVRLDLADLSFIDAAGLAALIEVRTFIRSSGGSLILHHPRPLLLRLLDVTELTSLFDVDSGDGPPNGQRPLDRVS